MSASQAAVVWKVLAFLAYWLGMLARVLLPYLKAYWESGGQIKFDWSYVKGQAAGSLIAFLGLLSLNGGNLAAEIGALSFPLAFLAGYFSASAGRESQKFGAVALEYKRTGPAWKNDDNYYG